MSNERQKPERALTDPHPRTRYPAGKDSVKLALLARFLPEKLMDAAILKTFGLPLHRAAH